MAEPTGEDVAGEEAGFACPHCGSTEVRRSSPHGLTEQLVRSFTPYHFYRCRACGRRGRYLGHRLPGHESSRSRHTGRPIENRDVRAARQRRWRLFGAVILSLGLGAAAGVYLHSCQQQAEQAQPPPQ